jgi:hypothetical protein
MTKQVIYVGFGKEATLILAAGLARVKNPIRWSASSGRKGQFSGAGSRGGLGGAVSAAGPVFPPGAAIPWTRRFCYDCWLPRVAKERRCEF